MKSRRWLFMIEKNYEIRSLLSTDSENNQVENNFLDCISKEKKDKKNGHGEDIDIRMFSFFPELYRNHSSPDDKNSPSVARDNRIRIQNTKLYEIQQSREKHQAIFFNTSKINGNVASLTTEKLLSNSRLAPVKTMAVNSSGKITHKGEDDIREQNTETMKIHAFLGQLKNDGIPLRQELPRQYFQQRKLQAEHILPVHMGAIGDSTAANKQLANINYPFLRWAGEHSVKVSMPMDLALSRHLSLLPSDSRVAETLSRQVSYLNGFSTELLNPQHNDEESERRHSQENQEEEQE